MDKDISKLESAIIEKYGEETNFNLDNCWTVEKEKEYLISLKESVTSEPEEILLKSDGYLQFKKLIIKNESACIVCKRYTLTKSDDVYLTKYECCEKCYIQHVEGREGKWEGKKKTFKDIKI
jgi:hypothetical protein